MSGDGIGSIGAKLAIASQYGGSSAAKVGSDEKSKQENSQKNEDTAGDSVPRTEFGTGEKLNVTA